MKEEKIDYAYDLACDKLFVLFQKLNLNQRILAELSNIQAPCEVLQDAIYDTFELFIKDIL